MKMTNNTLISIIGVINKCAANATGKTAYAMMRNRQILQNELKPFDEVKNQIFQTYGEASEDGKNYVVNKENKDKYEAFTKEISELLNIELDIELYQINEDEFKVNFNDNMTLYDYDLLRSVLVKDSDDHNTTQE